MRVTEIMQTTVITNMDVMDADSNYRYITPGMVLHAIDDLIKLIL